MKEIEEVGRKYKGNAKEMQKECKGNTKEVQRKCKGNAKGGSEVHRHPIVSAIPLQARNEN